jgi:secondary thiamine-phosphate synthase enzyme
LHYKELLSGERILVRTNLETVSIQTDEKQQLINITSRVRELVAASGLQEGMVGLFSQHTTAVLIVNEYQKALLDDIQVFLKRIVEEGRPYRHNSPEFSDCDRHNAASHLRSLLFSNNVLLPVSAGEVVLGQYQSVILAELDGPRERSVKVQLMGEGL